MILTTGSLGGHSREVERALEQRLIAARIQVVVPAVSGRVVREGKNETATQLSDLERVLILARNSGAEAVVEVDDYSAEQRVSRHFCSDGHTDFAECSVREYSRADSGRQLVARAVRLRGRVIDTQNGEVVALIEVVAPIVNWLELSYGKIDVDEARRAIDCGVVTGGTRDACADAARYATDALFDEAADVVRRAPIRKQRAESR